MVVTVEVVVWDGLPPHLVNIGCAEEMAEGIRKRERIGGGEG